MIELQFHKAALDLIGMAPAWSESAIAILRQREAKCAKAFPESVREWYSIDGAVDLLARYSNEDPPVPIEELGDPSELANGFLHIITENQGVVAWYIKLDGTDDPPVFDNNDDWNEDLTKRDWQLVSPTFSAFVFDRIADCYIDAFSKNTRLVASATLPSSFELNSLRGQFKEGPVSSTDDVFVRRYYDEHGIVVVVCPQDAAAEPASHWVIAAHSIEGLREQIKRVWPIQNLSETLMPEGSELYGEVPSVQVLRKFGRTNIDRRHPKDRGIWQWLKWHWEWWWTFGPLGR